MTTFLPMLICFLVGALGTFLAGLLGIGGGIIIIPVLAGVFAWQGISDNIVFHLAIGTSLAAVPFNAMITGITHHKHQKVEWPLVYQTAPGMIIGAMIGPMIATALSGHWLEWIFAGFLALMGIRYVKGVADVRERHQYSPHILITISPFLGILSSMLGLGGGVFIVPLLTRLGVNLRQAIAVSSMCLVPSSLVGVIGYIYGGWDTGGLPAYATGFVYWPMAVVLMITGLLFAPVGVKWAHRLPLEKLKRMFGLLLLAMAVSIAWSAWS